MMIIIRCARLFRLPVHLMLRRHGENSKWYSVRLPGLSGSKGPTSSSISSSNVVPNNVTFPSALGPEAALELPDTLSVSVSRSSMQTFLCRKTYMSMAADDKVLLEVFATRPCTCTLTFERSHLTGRCWRVCGSVALTS